MVEITVGRDKYTMQKNLLITKLLSSSVPTVFFRYTKTEIYDIL